MRIWLQFVVVLLYLAVVLGEKEKKLIVKTIKEAKECTKVSYVSSNTISTVAVLVCTIHHIMYGSFNPNKSILS